MHKEYHEKEFLTNGGIFQMIQLWVGLPKKDKFTDPRYQEITNDMMGKVKLPEEEGYVTVVAGEFEGTKGPALTFSPMNIYIVDIKAGITLKINEPASYNTGILLISGNMLINETECMENDFILFENKEGIISVISGSSDAKFILLSGEPLNEPQIAGGPFVMNTKEELRQASLDYREGRFGTDKF